MDLLVFLVRRRELDIAYISVSAIATDYLSWLDRKEELDLDYAGDFILLAAVLMQFKAAELLPTSEPEPSEAEMITRDQDFSYEDLAALKIKAAKLAELEEQQVGLFDIGGVHITGLEESLASEMLSDVSVYDMAIVFRSLIRELPPEPTFIIEEIPYSIEGQMAYILSFFENTKKVLFARLAGSLDSRLAVIMTFLAMLELMRLGKVSIRQPHPFGEFWLLMRVKYEAA